MRTTDGWLLLAIAALFAFSAMDTYKFIELRQRIEYLERAMLPPEGPFGGPNDPMYQAEVTENDDGSFDIHPAPAYKRGQDDPIFTIRPIRPDDKPTDVYEIK